MGTGAKQRSLRKALDFYIVRFTEKVNTGKKAVNTLKSLNTTRDKLYAFLKHHFRVSDMLLKDIKSSFAFDFEHHLTTIDRVSSNSAMRYIKIFKRVIKMAVDQEWLTSNPLTGFKCSYTEPQRERLTMDEIMTLYRKDLPIDRLAEVRDVYLFCCFTGFAYQEVATQIYAKVTQRNVSNNMKNLKNRLFGVGSSLNKRLNREFRPLSLHVLPRGEVLNGLIIITFSVLFLPSWQ